MAMILVYNLELFTKALFLNPPRDNENIDLDNDWRGMF